MVKKLTKGKKIARVFCIVVISICFIMILINLKDSGKYDYCVEWDGWIHRSSMLTNCYDIPSDTQECAYIYQDDGSLSVWYPDGSQRDKRYECSRYIKSKEVDFKRR